MEHNESLDIDKSIGDGDFKKKNELNKVSIPPPFDYNLNKLSLKIDTSSRNHRAKS